MRLKVTSDHWSPSPFTDWVASLGDDEDQINAYGRSAVEALEHLKALVADEDALVEAIDRKIRAYRRRYYGMNASEKTKGQEKFRA